MMKAKHLLSVITLVLSLTSVPWSVMAADNMTRIFNPRFATLQVYAGDNELNDAVLRLDDDDSRLTIEFDELADDVRYMRYSITHCNADWKPSTLVESEYLDGFNEGHIDQWAFSRATTVHYVHYTITLPNDQMKFTVSGNYLLKVWDEGDPDHQLLQARFMVSEQSALLSGNVSSRTDIDYNGSHQQLSLLVDAGKINVHDAFNDFIVTIRQNDREDNARTLIHPLRLQGDKLVYEHQPQLIFPGGNEYRRFENLSTRHTGMNIADVSFRSPYYHADVAIDLPRAGSTYLYDQTQHGGYVVREYDSDDSDTEADYVVTHLALSMPRLEGCDIYIDGDIVNRNMDGTSRMNYNDDTGMYEKALLLKQGAYNYLYLARTQGKSEASTAPIEGDYYNTANVYSIAVYHRRPGERYDRLVGYFKL
ncbi:MAG: DUF5103 domain-containing protein [Clostridiales bacterium]|nr:DUF5103 domain-containing protein [Clostridiales bacterium]